MGGFAWIFGRGWAAVLSGDAPASASGSCGPAACGGTGGLGADLPGGGAGGRGALGGRFEGAGEGAEAFGACGAAPGAGFTGGGGAAERGGGGAAARGTLGCDRGIGGGMEGGFGGAFADGLSFAGAGCPAFSSPGAGGGAAAAFAACRASSFSLSTSSGDLTMGPFGRLNCGSCGWGSSDVSATAGSSGSGAENSSTSESALMLSIVLDTLFTANPRSCSSFNRSLFSIPICLAIWWILTLIL